MKKIKNFKEIKDLNNNLKKLVFSIFFSFYVFGCGKINDTNSIKTSYGNLQNQIDRYFKNQINDNLRIKQILQKEYNNQEPIDIHEFALKILENHSPKDKISPDDRNFALYLLNEYTIEQEKIDELNKKIFETNNYIKCIRGFIKFDCTRLCDTNPDIYHSLLENLISFERIFENYYYAEDFESKKIVLLNLLSHLVDTFKNHQIAEELRILFSKKPESNICENEQIYEILENKRKQIDNCKELTDLGGFYDNFTFSIIVKLYEICSKFKNKNELWKNIKAKINNFFPDKIFSKYPNKIGTTDKIFIERSSIVCALESYLEYIMSNNKNSNNKKLKQKLEYYSMLFINFLIDTKFAGDHKLLKGDNKAFSNFIKKYPSLTELKKKYISENLKNLPKKDSKNLSKRDIENLIKKDLKNLIVFFNKNNLIKLIKYTTTWLKNNPLFDFPNEYRKAILVDESIRNFKSKKKEFFDLLANYVIFYDISKGNMENIDPSDIQKFGILSPQFFQRKLSRLKNIFNEKFEIPICGNNGPEIIKNTVGEFMKKNHPPEIRLFVNNDSFPIACKLLYKRKYKKNIIDYLTNKGFNSNNNQSHETMNQTINCNKLPTSLFEFPNRPPIYNPNSYIKNEGEDEKENENDIFENENKDEKKNENDRLIENEFNKKNDIYKNKQIEIYNRFEEPNINSNDEIYNNKNDYYSRNYKNLPVKIQKKIKKVFGNKQIRANKIINLIKYLVNDKGFKNFLIKNKIIPFDQAKSKFTTYLNAHDFISRYSKEILKSIEDKIINFTRHNKPGNHPGKNSKLNRGPTGKIMNFMGRLGILPPKIKN